MPGRRLGTSVFLGVVVVWAVCAGSSVSAQSGTAQETPRFRLLRTLSGSKGQESGGRFVIDDPRTVFQIPDDKQVVIYFQWQGPAGQHHIEVSWRNPEGRVATTASLDQAAPQGRFGAYWSMPLSDKTTPGLWALEARVDGEPAGIHTIQVVSGPGLVTVSRRFLNTGELYERAKTATAFVEKLNPQGDVVAKGSGFFLEDGVLLTTFHVIDGASGLLLTMQDGRRFETNVVVAWNRRQDWALLKTPPGAPTLSRAPERSWLVGDRCFSLDTALGSSRVIGELSITGRTEGREGGERLILGGDISSDARGSPLLNEYGEVVGVAGVNAGPEPLTVGFRPGVRLISNALLAVPIELVTRPADRGKPALLADLVSSGEFLPLLTASRHVFQASFGRKVETKGPVPSLIDEGTEFSRRDDQVILWVMWEPKKRLKTFALLRVYDLSNKLVTESKPLKMDLPAGPYSYTYWGLKVTNFQPMTYRVDLVIGNEPGWRGYVRIVD